MGWIDYYNLLEKYNGDFESKATQKEKEFAARVNPNDPISALELARKKFKEKSARGLANVMIDNYRN